MFRDKFCRGDRSAAIFWGASRRFSGESFFFLFFLFLLLWLGRIFPAFSRFFWWFVFFVHLFCIFLWFVFFFGLHFFCIFFVICFFLSFFFGIFVFLRIFSFFRIVLHFFQLKKVAMEWLLFDEVVTHLCLPVTWSFGNQHSISWSLRSFLEVSVQKNLFTQLRAS